MNISQIIALNTGILRAFFSKSQYEIKRGYKHKKHYTYLDKVEDQTNEWQVEVYDKAVAMMHENNYTTILDFGCGSAKKMLQKFNAFQSKGVDVKETVDKLTSLYPEKEWIDVADLDYKNVQADIVICADVIEHVLDPHDFLTSIQKIDFNYLVISTPDREILRGSFDYGPPINPFHIREWNGKEFAAFIAKYFTIITHQVTHYEQCTQMIVCKKK